MPTSTKVKTDKIITYHPDGSRQTLGYRVERLTERTVRRSARPADPHASSSLKERSTSLRSSVHVTNPPRTLPPVVHTQHATRETTQTLVVSPRLPLGWKHQETKERFDYHQGMKEASYASNTVTHKVMFFGPSPWDQVKDECHALKRDMKKDCKSAREAVKTWWSKTTF